MGQHASLYKLAAWRDVLRPNQLAQEPLCRFCLETGKEVVATVVDHVMPHRGDLTLFLDPDNLQSLCKSCHDKHKQSEEVAGFRKAANEDGWPSDVRHPFNKQSQQKV